MDQLKALADRYPWDRLDAAEELAANVIAETATNPDALEFREEQLQDLVDAPNGFASKRQRQELRKLAAGLLKEARLDVPDS
jgi:hypothetical protein